MVQHCMRRGCLSHSFPGLYFVFCHVLLVLQWYKVVEARTMHKSVPPGISSYIVPEDVHRGGLLIQSV